jgi:hypothetical protein
MDQELDQPDISSAQGICASLLADVPWNAKSVIAATVATVGDLASHCSVFSFAPRQFISGLSILVILLAAPLLRAEQTSTISQNTFTHAKQAVNVRRIDADLTFHVVLGGG